MCDLESLVAYVTDEPVESKATYASATCKQDPNETIELLQARVTTLSKENQELRNALRVSSEQAKLFWELLTCMPAEE